MTLDQLVLTRVNTRERGRGDVVPKVDGIADRQQQQEQRFSGWHPIRVQQKYPVQEAVQVH